MTKDNVVRPAFGKKKAEAEAPQSKPETPEASSDGDYYDPKDYTPEQLLRAQLDLVFMLSDHLRIGKVRDKLHVIGDYIFGLKNYEPNKANIKLRRQGMTSLSLKDLCEQAESSVETQWSAYPAYFGALTLEYHYRVKAALSLMSEDKNPADKK